MGVGHPPSARAGRLRVPRSLKSGLPRIERSSIRREALAEAGRRPGAYTYPTPWSVRDRANTGQMARSAFQRSGFFSRFRFPSRRRITSPTI